MMTMHASKHQAHVTPGEAYTGNSEVNMVERLFSPKVTNMSDEAKAAYPRSVMNEDSLMVGRGASRMVYQKLQSIPRDAQAMAELILRELAVKSSVERRKYGENYQICGPSVGARQRSGCHDGGPQRRDPCG